VRAPSRLQIGDASLVYLTIDAADGGSMPFVFQHGMGGDAKSHSAMSEMHRPAR
jgi:hypothetical protein